MDEELRVDDEQWRSIVEQARRQLNAKGLAKPAGLECEHGKRVGYALQKHLLADGSVGCYLMFRRQDGRCVHIGSFTVAAARFGQATPKKRVCRRPAGMPVVGRVINLACGRSVRVEVDERGLPYPVPVLTSTPSTNGHEYSNAERKAEAEEWWGEQFF